MVFFAARAKNGLAANRQMQNILRFFPMARAAHTSTQNAGWHQESTKHQSSWKIKEFSYQDMSTNTREKQYLVMGKIAGVDSQKLEVYSLGSSSIYMCDLRHLGKLLYLASPFLPENWKRNTFLFTERMNVGKALGTTGLGALQTTRTKSATDTISLYSQSQLWGLQ